MQWFRYQAKEGADKEVKSNHLGRKHYYYVLEITFTPYVTYGRLTVDLQ